MKDNYKIIKDEYILEESYNYVEIATPLGHFWGDTVADEIDCKYPSRFHASEIALTKALRKYAEAAVAQLKREVKLLDGLFQQSLHFAKGKRKAINNNSFRLIHGNLKQKKKELEKWETRVKNLTSSLKARIAARDKIVASYIEKDKTE